MTIWIWTILWNIYRTNTQAMTVLTGLMRQLDRIKLFWLDLINKRKGLAIMTDKEKLLEILKMTNNEPIEDILQCYLFYYSKDFSITRIKDFIDMLNHKYLYDKISELERARFVANERATWIQKYLKGEMWPNEEIAKLYLQPQIDNAQAIIDACRDM